MAWILGRGSWPLATPLWLLMPWRGLQAGCWPGGEGKHCPDYSVHSPSSSMGPRPAGPKCGAGLVTGSSHSGAAWSGASGREQPKQGARLPADQAHKQGQETLATADDIASPPKPTGRSGTGPWVAARVQGAKHWVAQR